jgi:4-hydroxy-tetrahydrodipicolinate reductase
MNLRIGINGAGGRMGRAVIAAAQAVPGFEIVATAGRSGGGFGDARAVIDFATPEGALAALAALPHGAAFVTGTTGLDARQQAAIEAAAQTRAVVQAGNFSVGVALLTGLVEIAAKRLDDLWDIEVYEAHHRRKADAPSGTALTLANAAARGRGVALDVSGGMDRRGARKPGAIGFAVSRAGGVIGEHEVSFTSERERVSLAHSAFDRAIFAEGALYAARWAVSQKPGMYGMADVLDLK